MVAKSPCDKVALREILSDADYRTIDDGGSLLPPSNEIFQIISEKMAEKGSLITPKHVYTIINNNRAGFRDMILKVFDIQEQVVSICENDVPKIVRRTTSIKVNLVISQEKWQTIAPQEKIYGKRIYWKLRPGWADVVAEALWMQNHLDCVFVFKNQSIFLSAIAKFYLTMEEFCRECNAKIFCTILKEPSKNSDVILECNRAVSHSGTKRRQLRGLRRLEVANFLIYGGKDAVTRRRKEDGRIKKIGDKNPPILRTNEVVRKVKEQPLLTKYGLQFGNPAFNLLKSAEHEPLQIYVSRVRNDPHATLTIDATGGIAKREKSLKPHIFLYQCVLVTRDGSVQPSKWIDRCEFLPQPYPRCKRSNSTNRCYRFWVVLANCGCAKSVHVVALSTCIGSEPSGKLLPSVHRLNFLNSKIKGIDLNNDDDNEDADQSDEEARNMNNGECKIVAEQNAAECESEITGWKSWRDKLYDAAVKIAYQSSNGDTINTCYNLDFAKRLRRYLLPYAPMWTAVMVPVFKRSSVTATSAAVEAEFADLKHREFRGEISMRIDWFRCKASDGPTQDANVKLKALVSTNLDESSETYSPSKVEDKQKSMKEDNPQNSTIEFDETSIDMKLQNNVCRTPNESTNNRLPSFEREETLPFQSAGMLTEHTIVVADSSRSFDNAPYEMAQQSRDENIPADNDWNVREEWEGLEKNTNQRDLTNNSPKKKREKPTCFDDCPEWDFIKHSTTANIPVLSNGNIAGPVRLDGTCLNVTSTCAFDSIFQGILSGLLAN
ncbi:Uncharacterized protein OBRU01_22372 [Operophtera brumata]|uniref:Uncharacterized protein n=1 Tax=Operophtera brumata TaxID=104452 RepID=A0A0L7KRR2_OPEBR|nr:Uncharacterized protein OBRU01_22372 [Operophtera brumata]